MKDKSVSKAMFTKDHYGKWVALSADRKNILGYADELSVLAQKFSDENIVYIKPLNPQIAHAF
jgi:hypothetical protein